MNPAAGEVSFGLSKAAARQMSPGGLVGVFLGLACLVAVVGSAVSDDDTPVAGVIVIGILGLFFLALGLLLSNGARVQYKRVRDGNQHQVCVGPSGIREVYPDGGGWSVSWQELASVSVAASDGGLGHDPRFEVPRLPGQRRAQLNSGLARGELTILRLEPVDVARFERDHADLDGRLDTLLRGHIGRVYPMGAKQRRKFADCVRGFSGPRWGGLWDETQRARTLGPAAGYDG